MAGFFLSWIEAVDREIPVGENGEKFPEVLFGLCAATGTVRKIQELVSALFEDFHHGDIHPADDEVPGLAKSPNRSLVGPVKDQYRYENEYENDCRTVGRHRRPGAFPGFSQNGFPLMEIHSHAPFESVVPITIGNKGVK